MGHFHPWRLAAVVLVLCAAIVGSLFWWRSRPSADVRSQLRRLPAGTGSIVYFDLRGLRQAGIQHLLVENRAAEDPDYRAFVNATGFDWKQDLDSALLAFRDEERFYLLTGRFDWQKISAYARAAEGGNCLYGVCRLSATRPEFTISLAPLRPGLLAMAVSKDRFAARAMEAIAARPMFEPPDDPVWVYMPKKSLQPEPGTPAGLRAFLAALADSDRAVFTIGGTVARIEVRLTASCARQESAEKVAARLSQDTELLKNLIAREGKKPSESDLSGVLTSGQFSVSGNIVNGRWPLPRPFIESLVR